MAADDNPTERPPRWADRLLEWFVAPRLREDLQGDLHEVYRKRLTQVGRARARREYGWSVIHYLTPYFHKRNPEEYSQPTPTGMWLNYLKIAWRNLLRSKSYSAINIFGLSVGMSCCMLLLLYIRSELSFDRHHQHTRALFLLGQQSTIGRLENDLGKEASSQISAPYAFALKAEFPEIAQVARLYANISDEKTLLQVRQQGAPVQSFYETKGYQVDSTFFDLFTYQFTEGNPQTALLHPNSVVLSEEVARKLFGPGPALHRIIRIGGTMGLGMDFRVSGVFRDESGRSHIDARFLVPIYAGSTGSYLRGGETDFANNNMFTTYIRLRQPAGGLPPDPTVVEKKFPAFIDKYARSDLNLVGFDRRLFLVPVQDLHLSDRFRTVVTPTNSMTYLYILGSIAVFTLLIACINFMNLATARSARRATEVGVRKVMGAQQGALIRQFLGESMVLTLVALFIALGLVALCLSPFNQLTNKSLAIAELFDPFILLVFLALALLTGLIAGSYPAFYLSLFNPARVLKGHRFTNSLSAVTLRRSLVVFQFIVSVGLVLATFVIQEQMRFLRDRPLGFTQDQQIAVPFRSTESRDMYTAYRNEVLRNNQVVAAAGTQYYPGIRNASDLVFHRPDQNNSQGQSVKTNRVDYEYLQTLGFRLVAGRLFSRQFPGDTNNRLVVNEATLRKFGVPVEKAVGQRLDFDWQGETTPFEIVGVVRDFHFQSLHQAIEPFAFLLSRQARFNYLIVHVNTPDMPSVLADLEQKWKVLRPDEPFSYTFLNEDFQKNYQSEVRTARIVSTFTFFSIVISCLGLFGLAAFAAQQRTKEIGVRKVLGASVANIVLLLAKDFLKLVVIAIVIASPLAWYAMRRWLQSFAYQIDIPWWMFLLAGGVAILIAFVTVSFQSIKAALTDPVKSLRTE